MTGQYWKHLNSLNKKWIFKFDMVFLHLLRLRVIQYLIGKLLLVVKMSQEALSGSTPKICQVLLKNINLLQNQDFVDSQTTFLKSAYQKKAKLLGPLKIFHFEKNHSPNSAYLDVKTYQWHSTGWQL